MLAKDLRQRYIDFFVNHHAHAAISGASLIPENDPTVLFTTAGMHPLVPYLMGEKHPAGKRIVDCQKSLRTDDIDEVGDATHLTFFEMMGNWSLGDYFKEGAIRMSYEFLTSALDNEGLGIDPERLHVSCFEGDNDAPKDEEAAKTWESLGFTRIEGNFNPDNDRKKIFFFGKKENWWGPAGQTGPCGPDTEMFYDTRKPACSDCAVKGPSCECGRYIEIWNDVFMEFNKKADGIFEPLAQQNVDTGLGLERVTAVLQNKDNLFETELFQPIFEKIRELASETDIIAERIIADHLRAAVFVLGDDRGITPSNTDQGYVVRRLIRRAVRQGRKIGIQDTFTPNIAKIIIRDYKDPYTELERNREHILAQLTKEESQFRKTLIQGEKEFEKILKSLNHNNQTTLSGRLAFKLYDTYGFPLEMTKDLARENTVKVDEEGFEKAFQHHQELSRVGAEQKFAGGLQDHSEKTTALHTVTHLLHQALRNVLGDHVQQKGSNITERRLRFDFSHSDKMTDEQLKEVETIINEKIAQGLPISCEEMTVGEAKEKNALGFFEHKYGDKVKVYTIGDGKNVFSREICGGPHIKNTKELKNFKIVKEQSSSAGVRRIKAVVNT